MEFLKCIYAIQAAKFTQRTYRVDALSERSCRKWFSHFGSGIFSMKEMPRVGRQKGFDSEDFEAAITVNPATTVSGFTETLVTRQSYVI